MSYDIVTFTAKVKQEVESFSHYANAAAELAAIQTALGADATTHDCTITMPPVGTQINVRKTYFTNSILLYVNRGKAGNLSNAAMATAIGSVGPVVPPTNTSAPIISGTGSIGNNLTCAPGSWTGTPDFTYQWLRSGVNIAGATNAVYALVGADSGTNCSCRVTGTNTAGFASATSNVIAVA